MKLPPLPSIKRLLDAYQVKATSSLGQNFILKQKINDSIVDSVGITNWERTVVVEVGPGPGCLTRSILRAGAKKVIAIEKDERMQPLLSQLQEAADGRLRVVYNDMLKVDQDNLLTESEENGGDIDICIMGNLPFNVASLFLLTWLRNCHEGTGLFKYRDSIGRSRTKMALMFQTEVSEALCAQPGQKDRYRLSCLTQCYMDTSLIYHVAAHDFHPKPKVSGKVVKFTPIHPQLFNTQELSFDSLSETLRIGWNERKKMLSNNFKRYPGLIEQAGIETRRRPGTLTVEEWLRIAKEFANMST